MIEDFFEVLKRFIISRKSLKYFRGAIWAVIYVEGSNLKLHLIVLDATFVSNNLINNLINPYHCSCSTEEILKKCFLVTDNGSRIIAKY